MKIYGAGDLRSICLAGAQGEGKTSTAEALLFNAKITTRHGRCHRRLYSRGGRVLGMDKSGKKDLIKGQVPLSEMFQYSVDLRSLTKDSGWFGMKHSHYEDTPPEIANTLKIAYQKTREAEAEK